MTMTCSNYKLGSSAFAQVLAYEPLLEIIFENFGPSSTEYEELKKCRLVCRKWNSSATKLLTHKYWKNREFLRLSNAEELTTYLELNAFPSPSSSSASMDPLIRSPEFSCYQIETVNVQVKLLNQFFGTFGEKIKSLTLTTTTKSTTPHVLAKQIEKYLKKCSWSLEELKILISKNHFHRLYISHKNEEFKIPNLSYLCLTLDLDDEMASPWTKHDETILDMILAKIPDEKPIKICLFQWKIIDKTIDLLQKYNQMENLKVLDMKRPRMTEIKALSRVGPELKLKFLGIGADYREGFYGHHGNERFEFPESLHDLLCTQANHLEILSWENIGSSDFGYFKFPVTTKMGELKQLKLSWDSRYPDRKLSPEEEEWRRTCPPILYEKMFPQLQELILVCIGGVPTPKEFEPLLLGPQSPCISLRRFEILHYNVTPQLLTTISATFPCITSLKIGSCRKWGLASCGRPALRWGDPTVQFFFNLWKFTSLEELSLEMDFNYSGRWRKYELDSLFSGVDEGTIAESFSGSKYIGISDESNDSDTTEFSSILNLKSLKKLSVSNLYHYGLQECGCSFTDFSAFYLFGRMEQLEFLHLEKGIRKFSRAGMNHLKAKGGNISHPSPVGKIEDVFRSGFTFRDENAVKIVNLLDSHLPDSEYDTLVPDQEPRRQGTGR